MVTDGKELLKVFVNALIFDKRGFGFHACLYLLGVILVVLLNTCIKV